jgi:hypothetical protein
VLHVKQFHRRQCIPLCRRISYFKSGNEKDKLLFLIVGISPEIKVIFMIELRIKMKLNLTVKDKLLLSSECYLLQITHLEEFLYFA